MRERIAVHPHPKGRGAIVEMNLSDGGWNGHYRVPTAGVSPDEAIARVNALALHHQKKAERLSGFSAVKQQLPGGYVVTDLSITERGTDVELVLRIATDDGRSIIGDAVYGSVGDIPADADILARARDLALADQAQRRAADTHINAIRTLLGVGGPTP